MSRVPNSQTVPAFPTSAMLDAGMELLGENFELRGDGHLEQVYLAMLAAAPEQGGPEDATPRFKKVGTVAVGITFFEAEPNKEGNELGRGYYDIYIVDEAAQPEAGAERAGWKLVPIEPTEEMLVAGQERVMSFPKAPAEDCEDALHAWEAMILVAPDATPD